MKNQRSIPRIEGDAEGLITYLLTYIHTQSLTIWTLIPYMLLVPTLVMVMNALKGTVHLTL